MNLLMFHGRNRALFEQLRSINESTTDLLERVSLEIANFEPSLLDEWHERGLWPKVEAYTLRYVIPMGELLGESSKSSVVSALVVQLLSCVAWRHFDDCVDGHGSAVRASLASSLSCLRLQAYSQRLVSGSIRTALEQHYSVMAEQAAAERSHPVALCDIWKRCSILMFAGESIARLSEDRMQIFRCYINYGGVAHDTHDFMSDSALGVMSLPALLMNEVNREGIFSISAVKALYEKVRRQVIPLEEMAGQLQIRARCPMIHHLFMESWRTIHEE
jgi:hypothetical protein